MLETGPQFDASKLSDSDKRELNQFIEAETQKAKIQECKHSHLVMNFLSFPMNYQPLMGSTSS